MSAPTPHTLPRSSDRLTVVSPPAGMALEAIPAWAASRHKATGDAVCVVGVVTSGRALHWLETAHARGWVWLESAVSLDGDTLAGRFAANRARGFVDADAALLALAEASGALPRLSWGEAPFFAAGRERPSRRLGLYAIVDSADRLQAVLAAGVKTVQVRIKRPPQPDAAWESRLGEELARSVTLARDAGAELFVNDHAQLAIGLGAPAIHLGQEDLLALGDEGRSALVASGVGLGISSHSVWELCRARALPARYIACGPVWATTTKDMPWVPQGLDNLAWWCAHAGAPVVAIGGILAPAQVEQAAACGADGVCLVRGLGEAPAATLPGLEAALAQGWAGQAERAPASTHGLHPSLPR